MRKARNGFTLTEMVVVMGMIILFIGMAIPTVRALTGNSSLSMARNALSATLVRTREDAIGVQDYRGIMFLVDKNSNKVLCVFVQRAAIQDTTNFPTSLILLDTVPNRDTVALPTGVRLQTMFNGLINWGGTSATNSQSAAGNDDRYMGFNPMMPQAPNSPTPANQRYIGGVILFDPNGRLVVKPYGFQLLAPFTSNSVQPSAMAVLLGFPPVANPTPPAIDCLSTAISGSISWAIWTGTSYTGSNNISCAIAPGCVMLMPPAPAKQNVCMSQLGLVLFDADAFKSLGFTDDDADMVPTGGPGYTGSWPGSSISEQTEEAWLDNNSTPVMINRFDGTLIRGE